MGVGDPQQQQQQQGKIVSIGDAEYRELLEIKAQNEEKERKLKEDADLINKQLEELAQWRSISSAVGSAKDPTAAREAFERIRDQEVDRVYNKIAEVMPELEERYKEAGPEAKQAMEEYVVALRNYMHNKNALKAQSDLKAVNGMVEIVSSASRRYNAKFTQQEAMIKDLQRKFEEQKKEKETLKRQRDEILQNTHMMNQSGSAGGKSIAPTYLGGAPQTATTTQTHPSTTHTPTTPVPQKTIGGATPLPPFGFHNQQQEGSSTSQALYSNASATDASGFPAIKRYRVAMDGKESDIEVADWDPSKGTYSRYGDAIPGNRTFAWLGEFIRKGRSSQISDQPAFHVIEDPKLVRPVDFGFNSTHGSSGGGSAYTPWL